MNDYRLGQSPANTVDEAKQRLTTAYRDLAEQPDTRHLERIAASYRPEHDAQAEQLRAAYTDQPMPASVRTALGFHESARAAANNSTTSRRSDMPTTTPKLADLPADALAAELARRQQEAEQREAEAEAAWRVEQARRARPVLDGWEAEETRLLAAEAEALEDFRVAVLADPVIAAFIKLRRHRYRRAGLRVEARLAAHGLGVDTGNSIVDLAYRDSRLLDEIRDIAEREASRLAGEDSQAVTDRLQNPESDRP